MRTKSVFFLAPIFCGIMIAFSNAASAQVPVQGGAPAAIKIGIVNIQEAIVGTNEGKHEFDALQQRFAPKENQIMQMNAEVERLKKQLIDDEAKLTEDQRRHLSITIETKQRDLDRNFEDTKMEFQRAREETINHLGEKMMAIVEKYATAHGNTAIFDASNPQTGLLWASQSANITKELINSYNSQYPIADPANKTATPKKPENDLGNLAGKLWRF